MADRRISSKSAARSVTNADGQDRSASMHSPSSRPFHYSNTRRSSWPRVPVPDPVLPTITTTDFAMPIQGNDLHDSSDQVPYAPPLRHSLMSSFVPKPQRRTVTNTLHNRSRIPLFGSNRAPADPSWIPSDGLNFPRNSQFLSPLNPSSHYIHSRLASNYPPEQSNIAEYHQGSNIPYRDNRSKNFVRDPSPAIRVTGASNNPSDASIIRPLRRYPNLFDPSAPFNANTNLGNNERSSRYFASNNYTPSSPHVFRPASRKLTEHRGRMPVSDYDQDRYSGVKENIPMNFGTNLAVDNHTTGSISQNNAPHIGHFNNHQYPISIPAPHNARIEHSLNPHPHYSASTRNSSLPNRPLVNEPRTRGNLVDQNQHFHGRARENILLNSTSAEEAVSGSLELARRRSRMGISTPTSRQISRGNCQPHDHSFRLTHSPQSYENAAASSEAQNTTLPILNERAIVQDNGIDPSRAISATPLVNLAKQRRAIRKSVLRDKRRRKAEGLSSAGAIEESQMAIKMKTIDKNQHSKAHIHRIQNRKHVQNCRARKKERLRKLNEMRDTLDTQTQHIQACIQDWERSGLSNIVESLRKLRSKEQYDLVLMNLREHSSDKQEGVNADGGKGEHENAS